MNLFRICFWIRAGAGSPDSWKGRYGMVMMWLFANDGADARTRGAHILRLLPYEEVIGETIPVYEITSDSAGDGVPQENSNDPLDQAYAQHADSAGRLGFSLLLLQYPESQTTDDPKIVKFRLVRP